MAFLKKLGKDIKRGAAVTFRAGQFDETFLVESANCLAGNKNLQPIRTIIDNLRANPSTTPKQIPITHKLFIGFFGKKGLINTGLVLKRGEFYKICQFARKGYTNLKFESLSELFEKHKNVLDVKKIKEKIDNVTIMLKKLGYLSKKNIKSKECLDKIAKIYSGIGVAASALGAGTVAVSAVIPSVASGVLSAVGASVSTGAIAAVGVAAGAASVGVGIAIVGIAALVKFIGTCVKTADDAKEIETLNEINKELSDIHKELKDNGIVKSKFSDSLIKVGVFIDALQKMAAAYELKRKTKWKKRNPLDAQKGLIIKLILAFELNGSGDGFAKNIKKETETEATRMEKEARQFIQKRIDSGDISEDDAVELVSKVQESVLEETTARHAEIEESIARNKATNSDQQ
jgi:hypothetical protein